MSFLCDGGNCSWFGFCWVAFWFTFKPNVVVLELLGWLWLWLWCWLTVYHLRFYSHWKECGMDWSLTARIPLGEWENCLGIEHDEYRHSYYYRYYHWHHQYWHSDHQPLTCQRHCSRRINKIYYKDGAASLGDRKSLIHDLSQLAGYLCAEVVVPPPSKFLHKRHNFGRHISTDILGPIYTI